MGINRAGGAADEMRHHPLRRDLVMGPLAEAFVRNFAQVGSGGREANLSGWSRFRRRYGAF
jgi:hypothetical protein